MGSRSLACALVRHRQAEPRGARRRPWTFDRVGPNCYVLRARTTGLLQGGVQCRASFSGLPEIGARRACELKTLNPIYGWFHA